MCANSKGKKKSPVYVRLSGGGGGGGGGGLARENSY